MYTVSWSFISTRSLVQIVAFHTASAFVVGVIAMVASARMPRPNAAADAASAAVHRDIGVDAAMMIPDVANIASVTPTSPGGLSRGPQFTHSTSRFTTVASEGARATAPPIRVISPSISSATCWIKAESGA
jgi:hypothetical protein